MARAAGFLLGALDLPGSDLSEEERALIRAESARTPFPSDKLLDRLEAVQARSRFSGEARFRWEEGYPLFRSLREALRAKPKATTPFLSYGFRPGTRYWPGLLTHMFLHAGFWHLFFNMLFLWAVGAVAEARAGGLVAAVFVVGGMAAGMAQVYWGLPFDAVMVGASGAVSAVMGWALLTVPRRKVKLAYVLILFVTARYGVFDAPLWFFLPLWLSQQLLMGLLTQGSAQVTVGYGAHLGGFLAGALLGSVARAFLPAVEEPEEGV